MTIKPLLFRGLTIRYSNILCFSKEVKLKLDTTRQIELNPYYPKNKAYYTIESKHLSDFTEMISIEDLVKTTQPLFIQSESNFSFL